MRMFAKKTFPEEIIFFWSNEERERKGGREGSRFSMMEKYL